MNARDIILVRESPDGTGVAVLRDGTEQPYAFAEDAVIHLRDGIMMLELPDGTNVLFESPGTDWDRVNAMTEEEIERNALDDPDNPPLTDEELERMVPVACRRPAAQ